MAGPALTEVFARFSTEVDTRPLRAADAAVSKVTDAFRGLGAVIGGGAAVAGLTAFTGHMSEALTEIELTADRLGLTTDKVQELGFIAGHAGKDLDTLVDAFSTLQERARDATLDPASDPATQLRLLGVSARNAAGDLKDGEQLFLEVADGIQHLGSQTDRVGAVMTLFGDVGRELLPVLQDGSAGIEELRAAYRELGGGATKEAIEANKRYRESMLRLDAVVFSLKSAFVEDLLPPLEKIADTVGEWISDWKDSTKNVDKFASAIRVATPVILAFGLGILASFAPVVLAGAALLALGLVVDDLAVAYEGGESAIRKFFLAHFEFDILPALDAMVDGWDFVRVGIGLAGAALRGFGSIWTGVWQGAQAVLATVVAKILELIESVANKISEVGGPIGALVGALGGVAGSGARAVGGFASRQANSAGRNLRAAPGRLVDGAFDAVTAGQQRRSQEMARRELLRAQNTVLAASNGARAVAAAEQTAQTAASGERIINQNVRMEINGVSDPEAAARAMERRLSRQLAAAETGE